MEKQVVVFSDLGKMDYKTAWDLQEDLLRKNVAVKSKVFSSEPVENVAHSSGPLFSQDVLPDTIHHLLFVEHPPVYTLGKSGKMENVIIGEEERKKEGKIIWLTSGKTIFQPMGLVSGRVKTRWASPRKKDN